MLQHPHIMQSNYNQHDNYRQYRDQIINSFTNYYRVCNLEKKSLRLTRVCKTVWFTISVLTTKQLQLATELGSSSLTHSVTLQVFTYLVDCSLAHCCLVRDAHSLSGRSLETIRLPYWFCGDNRPIKLMNIYAVSLTDSKHCTTESAVSVVSV